MSVHRVLPIVLAMLGGVAIGWVIKPSVSYSDAGKKPNEPVLKRETRRAGNENPNIAAQWIDKMRTGDVKAVAKEVPAAEIKAVMDGLMKGVWGTLSNEDIARLQSLLGEWAEKDPEGALAWARNLRHPTQREMALSCIAAAIGKKDPEAGFAIYTEVEKATIQGLSDVMYWVVAQVYRNAAKKSPEALLEAMSRTPKGGSFSSGLHVNFPKGFDFESLLKGMADAGYFKRTDRTYGVFTLESPLAEWAGRDRDAAFTYLADHVSVDNRHDLIGLADKVAESTSQAQMKEWMGGKLAAMDATQRQALVKGSLIGYPASYLNRFVEMIPTSEGAADLRYDILQANHDAGWTMDLELLNQMPEVEGRIAIIERLQGLRENELPQLASQLRAWQLPEERIPGILEKVKRKE